MSNQNMLDYLLDVEQQHSLLGQIFGKNLEAEQHVGGGDRVQGVGRQEHALEAVLPHLRGESNIQSNLQHICNSLKDWMCKTSDLCQSEVLWLDPHAPGDRLEDLSSAGVLLAHAHQELTHTRRDM